MKQATLGYLIERLERLDPTVEVYYDFVYFHPKGIHSYRGYYEQLALGYANAGDPPNVGQLLAELKDADGKEFTGYKGGEYAMRSDTPMWVAKHDEAGGTAIIDVEDRDWFVLLKTAKID